MNTGRYGFPFRGWDPLGPRDQSLAGMLGEQGIRSMLIHDTPMLSKGDFNFDRGYTASWHVRGHHMDAHQTDAAPLRFPCQAHKVSNPEGIRTYLRNVYERRHESQHMVAQTSTKAIEWLEANHRQDGFLLWVDTWDPHEPFDPPDHDWDLYKDSDFKGDKLFYPVYGRADYLGHGERDALNALYAGKITLVDRWVGRLIQKIEQLGLMRNTMVVWTTDHGHLFGEHELQGKPAGELGRLYEETTRIPLIIHHPEGVGAGARVKGIAQPPDIVPTVLDALGIAIPPNIEGKSLLPLMDGSGTLPHDFAISSRWPENLPRQSGIAVSEVIAQTGAAFDGLAAADVSDPITVTTNRWTYLCASLGYDSELYDLDADPKQQTNLVDDHPDVAEELRSKAIDFLREGGAPPQRLRPFTEEENRHRIPRDQKLWGFKDDAGLWISFVQENLARVVGEWELQTGPIRVVEELTFGQILDDDPKSLVRLGIQFHWASELA